MVKLINQSTLDAILGNIFSRNLDNHHNVSFEHLLEFDLPSIIQSYGVTSTLLDGVKYFMNIENVKVNDNVGDLQSNFYFGYSDTYKVSGDIVLTSEPPSMHCQRVVNTQLFDFPKLVDGVLQSRGKLRTCPPIKNLRFNTPLLLDKKHTSTIQVRSLHADKIFRSSSTIDMYINKDAKRSSNVGLINCKLPFQNQHVPIGILVQALGMSVNDFADLVKTTAADDYDHHLFLPYILSITHTKLNASMFHTKKGKKEKKRLDEEEEEMKKKKQKQLEEEEEEEEDDDYDDDNNDEDDNIDADDVDEGDDNEDDHQEEEEEEEEFDDETTEAIMRQLDVDKQEACIMYIARLYGRDMRSTGATILHNEVFPHLRNHEALKQSNDVKRKSKINKSIKDFDIDDFEEYQEESLLKENKVKIKYISMCVVQLILFHNGKIPATDRDSYKVCSITTSANHIGSLFRQLFIRHINTCGKLLRRAITQVKKKKVKGLIPVMEQVDVIKVFGSNRLTARLSSSISTGSFSNTRKGMTIQLNTNNDFAVEGQKRRISSSLSSTDGSHLKPRNIDVHQYGYIGAAATPDGELTGLVYEIGCTASISPPVLYRDNIILTQLVESLFAYKFFVNAQDEENNTVLIDGNGRIVSNVNDVIGFVKAFKDARRDGVFPKTVFIEHNKRFIRIIHEEGQLTRPLIVVDRMNLFNGTTDFEELLAVGVIELLNPAEEACDDVKVCIDINRLVPSVHTHLEITQTAFQGLGSSFVPFSTSQQGARSSYFTSQRKQIITANKKIYNGSITTTQLTHSHRNLVSSKTERLRHPNEPATVATPLVVAFIALPLNEEDGIILNKASIELGALHATTTRIYSSEATTPTTSFHERFERPGRVINKKRASYSALGTNGLATRGSNISAGDVLIGKTRSIAKTHVTRKIFRRDISQVAGSDGSINYNFLASLPSGKRAIVGLRQDKQIVVGDKLSNYASGKGIVSAIVPREDLPFSMKEGVAPDIVISPLSIISRNVLNTTLEALSGKAVCVSGDMKQGYDDQIYENSNKNLAKQNADILAKHGYNRRGTEMFIDGRTGNMIKGEVYTGVVSFTRLVHFASKLSARTTGKRDILTRQATEGRRNGGGLRTGEMEVVSLVASGASMALHERLCELSDKVNAYICKDCKSFAIGNDEIGYRWCKSCQNSKSVCRVVMPNTTVLLVRELMSTNIDVKFNLKEL